MTCHDGTFALVTLRKQLTWIQLLRQAMNMDKT